MALTEDLVPQFSRLDMHGKSRSGELRFPNAGGHGDRSRAGEADSAYEVDQDNAYLSELLSYSLDRFTPITVNLWPSSSTGAHSNAMINPLISDSNVTPLHAQAEQGACASAGRSGLHPAPNAGMCCLTPSCICGSGSAPGARAGPCWIGQQPFERDA
jgi:hypothetical protein